MVHDCGHKSLQAYAAALGSLSKTLLRETSLVSKTVSQFPFPSSLRCSQLLALGLLTVWVTQDSGLGQPWEVTLLSQSVPGPDAEPLASGA